MNITETQLRAFEAEGWRVASSVWTAAGNQCLLRRGDDQKFVTVTDAPEPHLEAGTAREVVVMQMTQACGKTQIGPLVLESGTTRGVASRRFMRRITCTGRGGAR